MTSDIRASRMEEATFAEMVSEEPTRTTSTPQPTFAGLDAGSYPGDKAMDAYREIRSVSHARTCTICTAQG
ncbi:hypothetical protein ACVIGB_008916 [Bradyrhizobium sp. USDA 4341]